MTQKLRDEIAKDIFSIANRITGSPSLAHAIAEEAMTHIVKRITDGESQREAEARAGRLDDQIRKLKATVADLPCPGGGWNGMPEELEGDARVKNCLAHGVCGCVFGDAIRDEQKTEQVYHTDPTRQHLHPGPRKDCTFFCCRDMPYIDAVISSLHSSCDEETATEQAIVFDQQLAKSGWSIVRTPEIDEQSAPEKDQ